jgi:hypothetical protein
MTTQVIQIAERRRRAMINQWVHHPVWALVQVMSPDMLWGKVQDITGEAEARIGRVGSHRERSVIMLEGGPDRDRTWSVWVRATFSKYKPAYLAFISHAYGVTLTGDDVPGYEVDHLSNKAYAPSGQEFIRVEAIPTAINHRWGVNFESRRTENTDARPSHRLSYMSCAKLGGQLPPTGPNDTAGINALVAYFTSIGLDPQEAREGVTNMMQHAYWRR